MSDIINKTIQFVEGALNKTFPKYPVAVQSSHDDPYVLCVDVFAVPPDLVSAVEAFIFGLQQELPEENDCFLLPMVNDLATTQQYFSQHMPVPAPTVSQTEMVFEEWLSSLTMHPTIDVDWLLPKSFKKNWVGSSFALQKALFDVPVNLDASCWLMGDNFVTVLNDPLAHYEVLFSATPPALVVPNCYRKQPRDITPSEKNALAAANTEYELAA